MRSWMKALWQPDADVKQASRELHWSHRWPSAAMASGNSRLSRDDGYRQGAVSNTGRAAVKRRMIKYVPPCGRISKARAFLTAMFRHPCDGVVMAQEVSTFRPAVPTGHMPHQSPLTGLGARFRPVLGPDLAGRRRNPSRRPPFEGVQVSSRVNAAMQQKSRSQCQTGVREP